MLNICLSNDLTGIFVGKDLLSSVCDMSITWTYYGESTAIIESVLPLGKKDFDLIDFGTTIDVVHFECDGMRKTRENAKVLFSIVGINAIEKHIPNIVASGPDNVRRMTIEITFCGILKFGGLL